MYCTGKIVLDDLGLVYGIRLKGRESFIGDVSVLNVMESLWCSR